MSDGRVALLWHLHQPDYRHPVTGVPVMPWARLHALRGYRDLAVEAAARGTPVTINLVPSLVEQLQRYAAGEGDRHLVLTARPAGDLHADEAAEVIATFVTGHPAMRAAHAPWARLAARIVDGERLGVAGLRDLQVWSTLAWFGATAVRDFPELAALRAKGAGYDEADKAVMLAAQERILRALPAQLFALARVDGPSLSASPLYHPILPLLIDTDHARRNLDVPAEGLFRCPEDALLQLREGRERLAAWTGVAPRGVWPSEGSVSPEVVALVAQAGFRWLATDDGVLARSERQGRGAGGWDLGQDVIGFFRDHELSDRVGFQYATRDPAEAATELVGEALRRAHGGVTLIALDGENPWEAWPDAGDAFRGHLDRFLATRGVTLDDAAERAPVGAVTRLHTGSWIGAGFSIWYGHAEDRAAWRLLGDARRAIARVGGERGAEALRRLLPAEGSDWMWWYGEDFHAEHAPLFDALFREHVAAAWRALGAPVPEELLRPLIGPRAPTVVPPRGPVAPALDPSPSWLHWADAGRLTWPPGGAMARGVIHALGLRFGWSADALWIRVVVPSRLPPEPGARWRVTVGGRVVEVPYDAPGEDHQEGIAAAGSVHGVVVRCDLTGLAAGPVAVVVEVVGTEVVRYPEQGEARLPRPESAWWSV